MPKKGFTLVELLVVISIIAILSVIGIVVFTGVQKGGRDAKRRGDIDAVAKALEVHFNGTANQGCGGGATGTYCPLQNAWFAGGALPQDTTTAKYCLAPGGGINGNPTNWPASRTEDGGCPSEPGGLTNYARYNPVAEGIPAQSATYPITHWKVCARLEASIGDTTATGLQVYCKASAQ